MYTLRILREQQFKKKELNLANYCIENLIAFSCQIKDGG
jgi:hypothetical protein